MKREEIEKAANEKFEDNSFAYKGFIKGAEWRINSVWNDAEEQPKNWYETCLVELGTLVSSFFTLSYYHHGGFSCMDGIHNKNIRVIKWAYLKDLTLNMEEYYNGHKQNFK